jgi:predicted DNA-binding transcriptional regulator AlpA
MKPDARSPNGLADRPLDVREAAGFPPVETIAALPPESLPAVLAHLAALQTAVAARLATTATQRRPLPIGAPDRNLTIREAAERAGMSVDWFYRHACSLPFARRIGRKRLFSEQGLARWLATRA